VTCCTRTGRGTRAWSDRPCRHRGAELNRGRDPRQGRVRVRPRHRRRPLAPRVCRALAGLPREDRDRVRWAALI
jgi:hypothetical protein